MSAPRTARTECLHCGCSVSYPADGPEPAWCSAACRRRDTEVGL